MDRETGVQRLHVSDETRQADVRLVGHLVNLRTSRDEEERWTVERGLMQNDIMAPHPLQIGRNGELLDTVTSIRRDGNAVFACKPKHKGELSRMARVAGRDNSRKACRNILRSPAATTREHIPGKGTNRSWQQFPTRCTP